MVKRIRLLSPGSAFLAPHIIESLEAIDVASDATERDGRSPRLFGSAFLAESGIGPQISDVQIRGDSCFALRDLKQGRANARDSRHLLF